MQRVALIVVTGLLSACAAKPADPGGCTTPLTAQCIDDRVWICQPDGDLKLTKICAAGCTDGECDPVPPPVDTPDVVEATDTGAPPTDTQADAEDVPEITDAADVPEPDDVDGDAEEDADSEETIEEPEDVEDVEDAETTGEVVEDTAEPDEPEDVYTGTEPIDIEPGCTMSDKAVMAPGGDFVDAHAGCTHDCHDDIQFGEGAYSSCVALCMFTELGNFTLECAMCAGLWSWCFESTCLPPCAVSEEDPECIECLETECDVPFDQCIGL